MSIAPNYLLILLKAVRLLINKLTNPSSNPSTPLRTSIQHPTSNIQHPTSSIYLITLLFALLLQIFLPSGMTVFILTVILLALAAWKEPLEIKLGKLSFLLILPVVNFF